MTYEQFAEAAGNAASRTLSRAGAEELAANIAENVSRTSLGSIHMAVFIRQFMAAYDDGKTGTRVSVYDLGDPAYTPRRR